MGAALRLASGVRSRRKRVGGAKGLTVLELVLAGSPALTGAYQSMVVGVMHSWFLELVRQRAKTKVKEWDSCWLASAELRSLGRAIEEVADGPSWSWCLLARQR